MYEATYCYDRSEPAPNPELGWMRPCATVEEAASAAAEDLEMDGFLEDEHPVWVRPSNGMCSGGGEPVLYLVAVSRSYTVRRALAADLTTHKAAP